MKGTIENYCAHRLAYAGSSASSGCDGGASYLDSLSLSRYIYIYIYINTHIYTYR